MIHHSLRSQRSKVVVILQSAEWSLPALRKIAGSLLTRKENESLSILEWTEWWDSQVGWRFSERTVARYRGGLLLVRESVGVNPEDLIRHELGHHISLHETGRLHSIWKSESAKFSCPMQLRGLSEGFADEISVLWGGKENPFYVSRSNTEKDFGKGYFLGRDLI